MMSGRDLLLLFLAGAVIALASCTTTQAVTVPERVKVQVPVPCVKERPQRPALRTEAELMAMDRYRRTLAAWSDLKRWEAYGAELEAIVEACSRIPAAGPAPP